MKTIILPGFSLHNKAWAEETKEKVDEDVEIVYWPHWQEGQVKPSWKEAVIDELLKEFEGQKINIIAKSVGTIVAMKLLKQDISIINKIILCGIPISDFEVVDAGEYKILANLPIKNILVIQNDNDPYAKYSEVEKMIHAINSDIEVVSMPASTHDYPYFEEFKTFLS